MKVSELEGPALDYWAMRAKGGYELELAAVSFAEFVKYFEDDSTWSFMLHWDVVGQIIDHLCVPGNDFAIYADETGIHAMLKSEATGPDCPQVWLMNGDTPMVAVLRCLVASKYGSEVPDDGLAA